MNTVIPFPKTMINGSPNGAVHRTAAACRAFTLIELLVVIAIIAILAGLGFAGVNGALKTARKAEVRAMANQVKLALTAYYADYGVWPTNEKTDANFLGMITGQSTTDNKRAIRYLEPAAKFTNGSGLVTPANFYAAGQSNFTVIVDTNYDGKIEVVDANSGAKTNISGSVALYVKDPDKATGYITTY
jgi:prepilin-type N-terminal cleavage/methylation domain-containing protein